MVYQRICVSKSLWIVRALLPTICALTLSPSSCNADEVFIRIAESVSGEIVSVNLISRRSACSEHSLPPRVGALSSSDQYSSTSPHDRQMNGKLGGLYYSWLDERPKRLLKATERNWISANMSCPKRMQLITVEQLEKNYDRILTIMSMAKQNYVWMDGRIVENNNAEHCAALERSASKLTPVFIRCDLSHLFICQKSD